MMPIKITIVHNFYRQGFPSGENSVVFSEMKMLHSEGHKSSIFDRQSDELQFNQFWGALKAGLLTPWNFFTARKFKNSTSFCEPNVVHVHNTFPLISPSVFYAASKRSATVLTLHNYRLLCPAAIPMRHGKVCVECIIKKSVWPAIRHGCYRSSRLATFPLAINVALHRALGTWTRKVDAFIALSDFQRDLMIQGGLPGDKIFVKPNFFPGRPDVVPYEKRGAKVVFVGRLSEEKGVHSLIKAWEQWGVSAPALQVIGEGPLRMELEQASKDLPVEFLGQVSSENTLQAIANAHLLVLPSECFEGFPMVIREAFALGTAVAVSNIGPLPSIVEDGKTGVVFKPADPESLMSVVRSLWEAPDLLQRMGKAARIVFEEKYTEEANYEQLMEIYAQAIKNAEARGVSIGA